jgi:mono/diheme cytochrome c family protein
LKKKSWASLLMVAVAVTAVGCGQQEPAKPLVDADSSAAKLYAQSCSGCHGDSLQGRSGPKLFGIGERLDQAAIEDRIKKGGRGMPAFEGRLEQAQIQELAAWLAKQK